MRHVLGIAGVTAAAVLLIVSAAMNWRFGYTLGKSDFESQLYGAASAAADCFKALLPFFIFAALRNRSYSQALGGALLFAVCFSYSLTSSLGFAALNRADSTGSRVLKAETHQDLRLELDRSREALKALPSHRPAGTVSGEIAAFKQNARWAASEECNNATSAKSMTYCEGFYKLKAELAVAEQSDKLDTKVAQIRTRLGEQDAEVGREGGRSAEPGARGAYRPQHRGNPNEPHRADRSPRGAWCEPWLLYGVLLLARFRCEGASRAFCIARHRAGSVVRARDPAHRRFRTRTRRCNRPSPRPMSNSITTSASARKPAPASRLWPSTTTIANGARRRKSSRLACRFSPGASAISACKRRRSQAASVTWTSGCSSAQATTGLGSCPRFPDPSCFSPESKAPPSRRGFFSLKAELGHWAPVWQCLLLGDRPPSRAHFSAILRM